MATITARSWTQGKKQFLTAAGGALVALTVAAGIGAWWYGDIGGDSRQASVASLPSVSGDAPAAIATTPREAATAPALASPQEVPTLYIVANEEDALRVRAGIEMFGPMTQQHRVIVLDEGMDAGTLAQFLAADSQSAPKAIDLRGY